MIFHTLDSLGIPYLVIKYKLTSSIDENIIDYRYQIIVDYDIRLFRLGFKAEKEIKRYESLVYVQKSQTAGSFYFSEFWL